MTLVDRIPDQLTIQDTDFSLDLEPYFDEPVLDFQLLSPSFLSFSSRKLVYKDLSTLPYFGIPPWTFREAVVSNEKNVYILMHELGLLIYDAARSHEPTLLQHFFEERVCINSAHLAVQGDVLSIYNSSHISLIDVSAQRFPVVITTAKFPVHVSKAIFVEKQQILVLAEEGNVLGFDFETETGISQNATLTKTVVDAIGAKNISDLLVTLNRVFFLDAAQGLISVSLPLYNNLKTFEVYGQHMSLSNNSLVIDGRQVLTLETETVSTIDPPLSSVPDHYVLTRDSIIVSNSSHLVAVNPVLNLTTIEAVDDLMDLGVINSTLVLVREKTVVLRRFAPEKAILHGRAPNQTGSFEVHFIAKGRTGSVDAHFMLMVEAPPLEMLMYLLGGSIMIILTVGLACYLFKIAVERKRVMPGLHPFNEEFTSASRLPRALGPIPYDSN